MGADPVLVLQMRRMGDLILTFPLLLHLARLHPGSPLWVVADPLFFRELLPLTPKAVYFPPAHCDTLAKGRYAAAINLSGAPEAARCMARLEAPLKLGPVAESDGLRVRGFWQTYRASLTQNNRHNAFHWADLPLLDTVPQASLAAVPRVRVTPAGTGRVGLVLGASAADKRPDAAFWARLAQRLAARGSPPLLLGGPAEAALGAEVERRAGLAGANLCGRLPLRGVAEILRTLDLCVTPDTGPMHLADFLGVPVLNLSMGPVQARETGPTAPGQWVLRAALSCVGCWQCARRVPACRQSFTPQAVARIILDLLEAPGGAAGDHARPTVGRGLALHRTGRDALGLHSLPRVGGDTPSCRPLLEDFWQAVFLTLAADPHEALLRRRVARLAHAHPALTEHLDRDLTRLCARCARHLQHGGPLPASFWQRQPGAIRLFTGHLHMCLQNADFRPQAWREALDRLAWLAARLHAA